MKRTTRNIWSNALILLVEVKFKDGKWITNLTELRFLQILIYSLYNVKDAHILSFNLKFSAKLQ
jgi:hypothetical protein